MSNLYKYQDELNLLGYRFRYELERSSEGSTRGLRGEDLLRLVFRRARGFGVTDVGLGVAPEGLEHARVHRQRAQALPDRNQGVDGGRGIRFSR